DPGAGRYAQCPPSRAAMDGSRCSKTVPSRTFAHQSTRCEFRQDSRPRTWTREHSNSVTAYQTGRPARDDGIRMVQDSPSGTADQLVADAQLPERDDQPNGRPRPSLRTVWPLASDRPDGL